jgi:hypothetical protein
MRHRLGFIVSILTALLGILASPGEAARPEGTRTVAVATFGGERWRPQLHPGAEDVVLIALQGDGRERRVPHSGAELLAVSRVRSFAIPGRGAAAVIACPPARAPSLAALEAGVQQVA